jgi:hypothetical protein
MMSERGSKPLRWLGLAERQQYTKQAVADSTNQIGGFLFNLSAGFPK